MHKIPKIGTYIILITKTLLIQEFEIQLTQQNKFVQLRFMAKISCSLLISIIVVFLAARCQSAMIDWPTYVVNSSDPSGFLKKFQISNDHPKDNKTFTLQAIFYLKRDIQWQGLSDRNIIYIYGTIQGKNKTLNLKDLRQFASDAEQYKAGDNITLGFNYTFNSSQNGTNGKFYVQLGNEDRKKGQYFEILFKMPNNNQSYQVKQAKRHTVFGYKQFVAQLKIAASKRKSFRKSFQGNIDLANITQSY